MFQPMIGAARACAPALVDPTLARATVTEPDGPPVTVTCASTEGSDSPFAVTQVILKNVLPLASEPPEPTLVRLAPAEKAVPVAPGGRTPQSVLRTRWPPETGDAVWTL